MIGMILGSNIHAESMYDYSQTMTTVFLILFYFVITSIMVNMFWVFVKNNIVESEINSQVTKNNKEQPLKR